MKRPAKHMILLSVSLVAWSASAIADEDATRPSEETDVRAPAPDPAVRRQVIEAANAAMLAEDWTAAAEAWGRLAELDPGLADAAYNRGVAQYRAGEFEDAAESFQRAARLGDASLAARSMYNEGTARYAEAVRSLDAGEDAPAPVDPEAPDPIQDAIERVGRSLEHFRDAIDADPTSLDARANAELAHRLLRRLEEVQQQQQQQQGEGEPQDSESGEGEPQEQPQDSEGEGEDEPSQQQPQEGEGEPSQQQPREGDRQESEQQPQDEDGEQPSPSDEEAEGEGEAEQQPSPADDEASSEDEPSATASEGTDDDGENSPQRMSREAAERLLQSVRDKERQRRREKAREESRGPRKPVERDW